jgi:hypothetical protein
MTCGEIQIVTHVRSVMILTHVLLFAVYCLLSPNWQQACTYAATAHPVCLLCANIQVTRFDHFR